MLNTPPRRESARLLALRALREEDEDDDDDDDDDELAAAPPAAPGDAPEAFWRARRATLDADFPVLQDGLQGMLIAVRVSSSRHRARVRRGLRFNYRAPDGSDLAFYHLRPSYVVAAGTVEAGVAAAKDFDRNVIRPAAAQVCVDWAAAVGDEAKLAVLVAFELNIFRWIVPVTDDV